MPGERRSSSLEPPVRTRTGDPGAHDLESDSDEHFSDAKSGPISPATDSPVPRTRVEKVDDDPSYGEVPGTEAWKKRTEDAQPDEIAILETSESKEGHKEGSTTPGGHPVPKTVVDESEDGPGSETHHHHESAHKADAAPDFVRKADGTGAANPIPSAIETSWEATDTPIISPAQKSPSKHRRKSSAAAKSAAGQKTETGDGADEDDADDNDFGDDFDDFEEGDEDADFGDFDDGFQEATVEEQPPVTTSQPQVSIPSFPILDLDGLDSEDILSATEPYMNALFPSDITELPILPSPPKDNPIFFNPRSASLWSQLAAPPPLQPPDWIRSRIRRLFLVSLGVPVDLDEILPAKKQNKLVLPSLHKVTSTGSLRTSTDSRALSRVRRDDGNESTVSFDSQGKEKPSSSRKRSRSRQPRKKGPPPAPQLDLNGARQLCATTEEALNGMTDEELRVHMKKLQDLEGLANEMLEYWKKKTDEKIGDREAFEGVIENLVKHARKTRK